MSSPPQEKCRVKRPRTSFTNAQRLQICAHRDQNPSLTQSQLAAWAQEALELPRPPSQAMISNLLKRKNDFEIMTTDELSSKSRRTVRFPQLDAALARWVSYCEETGVPVTGEAIRTKAAKFAQILHLDAPLTFSNGWLYKFNERHGFNGQKGLKNSRASADAAVLELQRRLQQFEPKNVFAMDETALFFNLFPDRKGRRLTKRVTIALSCNADGSEKLPPLFVGKSEKPRGFTTSTATEMNYTHNADTFMTKEILIKWLRKLDAKFAAEQRKCALLLDHVAVHAGFNVEELRNVDVMFLPLGATNNLQPFTGGISTGFKKRYRRRQIQHALDHLDADADMNTAAKFDSVGVKQALSWCIESWEAVPSMLISRCWQDTGLLYTEDSEFDHEYHAEEDTLSEELAVMLSWVHASEPLSVEELVNLPEENVIMEEPTDEDFCAPVESVRVAVEQPKTKPDEDGGLSAEELKERLKWIAKLLIYADEKGVPTESMSGMRVLQRDFRDQLNKKQAGSS